MYVDNFIHVAESRAQAERALDLVFAECQRRSLPTHDEVRSSRQLEALGWLFDGEASEFRPTLKRAWRLYLAIAEILRKPHMSSKQLEVIIGYYTFLSLLRRPLLAAMRAVHSCAQREYRRPCPLWSSVLRELRWMRSLLPIAVCDQRAKVAMRVMASDASLDGQGVVVGYAPQGAVSELFRNRELWRFRDERVRSFGARQQVHDARLGQDPCSAESLALERAPVPAVPVVRGRLLDSQWTIVSSRPWRFGEHITVLEARAALAALSHSQVRGCIGVDLALCRRQHGRSFGVPEGPLLGHRIGHHLQAHHRRADWERCRRVLAVGALRGQPCGRAQQAA